MLPSPADGMPTAQAPNRPGRAWSVVQNVGMQPEYEAHPAAATLHRLADMEQSADHTAIRKAQWARAIGVSGTSLTLLALGLAAIAGFGSLNELVGPRAAAIIALASAVASAISAFLQTKASGPALQTEADLWRNYADDLNDSVVSLISRLPMTVDEFRSRADAALLESRTRAPTRAHRVKDSQPG
jgi:hypothetical protein